MARPLIAERPFVLLSQDTSDRVLLVLHGGCWTSGDETSNEQQCREWTKQLGVATVRYHFDTSNYANSMMSLVALMEWAQQSFSSEKIGLVGCSSGGQLALGLTLELHRIGKPLPAFLLCLAPVVHPFERYTYLSTDAAQQALSPNVCSTMRKQHLTYWGTLEAMQAAGDELFTHKAMDAWSKVPHGVHILFGDVQDANVPRAMSEVNGYLTHHIASAIALAIPRSTPSSNSL
jgi:acetyl esterase/lipase